MIVAAIILWDTVYHERVIAALREAGRSMRLGCRIWPLCTGITSISPAITVGDKTRASRRAALGRCAHHETPSVLYIPFRQTTPSMSSLFLRYSLVIDLAQLQSRRDAVLREHVGMVPSDPSHVGNRNPTQQGVSLWIGITLATLKVSCGYAFTSCYRPLPTELE